MLSVDKIISKWVDDDVKTILKGEHTQCRQATIRRNQIRANVHLNEDEKRAMYEKYCEKLQATLSLMSSGIRIGTMPRYDD